MCSGCFRKGEKSMRCQYCGNEMREGALFCSQCGNRAVSQAAPVKKICPNCGEAVSYTHLGHADSSQTVPEGSIVRMLEKLTPPERQEAQQVEWRST